VTKKMLDRILRKSHEMKNLNVYTIWRA